MNEKRKRLIHTAYTALTCVLIAALAIMYTIACIGLYLEGDGAFTRESIGDVLIKLLVPSILTILVIVGAPILHKVIPLEKKKERISLDPSLALEIAKRKAKGKMLSTDAWKCVVFERKYRLIFTLFGAVLFVASMVYPIIRTFNADSFTNAGSGFANGDANVQVLTMSAIVIVFLIPTAVYAIVMSYHFDKSRTREASVLRTATENADVPVTECNCAVISFFEKNKTAVSIGAKCAIVAVAVLFIILGILNDGNDDVLGKAVKICRECIGLG